MSNLPKSGLRRPNFVCHRYNSRGTPGRQAGMSWFKREDHEIVNDSEKTVRTEGLWIRCPDCGQILFKAQLEARSTDPLDFTDLKPYKKRLAEAQRKTGLDDAIINAVGRLGQHDVVVSAMEYNFIGGSMGSVVGETIARAVDRSLSTRLPLIIVSASGGARMMEGIASLMQLAKIS